jgi:hypothetical protein
MPFQMMIDCRNEHLPVQTPCTLAAGGSQCSAYHTTGRPTHNIFKEPIALVCTSAAVSPVCELHSTREFPTAAIHGNSSGQARRHTCSLCLDISCRSSCSCPRYGVSTTSCPASYPCCSRNRTTATHIPTSCRLTFEVWNRKAAGCGIPKPPSGPFRPAAPGGGGQ